MSATADRPPADAAARAAIVGDLDATVFVAAGAGTGKTTSLIDRLVSLVASGRARIDQVAVVTFTEAAAAELRRRLRGALAEAAAGRPWRDGAPDLGIPEALVVDRARAALADVEDAVVTTLHGFAQAVLRAHALAAGIPPAFTVLDETAAADAIDTAWRAAVRDLVADGVMRQVLERAVLVGIPLPDLARLHRRMSDNWDRVGAAAVGPHDDPHALDDGRAVGGLPLDDVVGPLEEAIALGGQCVDPEDRLLQHLMGLAPLVAHLRSATDDADVLLTLRDGPTLSCRLGKKANWPVSGVDTVRERCARAEAARQRLIGDVGRQCLERLGRWLAHRVVEDADGRARAGTLTFHDLLAQAARLVRDRPEVRRAVSARWPYLFLDELQDTDPIQAELAVRIAAVGEPPADQPWTQAAVEAGRLFLVGDAKQAIYRFRRADVAVVEALARTVGGRGLALTDNWRSVPGVVDWVNGVIGPLFAGSDPGVQAVYEPLVARRRPLDGPPPVTVLGGPLPKGTTAAECRRAAMDDVAGAVAAAVGRWPVADGRPARPDDVCVLLPARTALPELQAALDAHGIAYQLDSGSLIYASSQVRDVLAVLRAVDDPSDPVAVVGALRTALTGCGDDDLATYRLAGGRWDALAPAPEGPADDHPVVAALAVVRALHQRRSWDDPATLVAEAIEHFGATIAALDERRWTDAWRRLRFLAAEARAFTDGTGGDLRQFLRWADGRADEHVRTGDVDLVDAEGGAVHVMTVHGAKGLEFPVAVVAGLDSPPTHRPSVDVLFDRDDIELRVGQHRTPGHQRLDDHEKACDAAERTRLLYVAATRARDHLVVAAHHVDGRPCLAADVHRACADVPHLWSASLASSSAAPTDGPVGRAGGGVAGPAPAGDTDARAVAARSPDEVRAAHEQWVARWADRLARDQRPVAVTATAIAATLGVDGAEPHRRAASAEATGASDGRGSDPTVGDEDGGGTLGDGTGGVVSRDGGEGAASGDDGERGAPADGEDDGIEGEGGGIDEDAVDDDDTDGDRPMPWHRRGRAASALGRAVHATLQVVDLVSGRDVVEQAAAAAAAEGVPARAATVARLAQLALRSTVVRGAVASGRYWREVYVGAPVAGVLVEGIVDLLVQHGNGLQVVDYKTDLLRTPEAVDAAVRRYRHQGAAYALVLARTTGIPVTSCTFVFLRAAGAPTAEPEAPGIGDPAAEVVVRTIDGEELAATVADVERLLHEQAAVTR